MNVDGWLQRNGRLLGISILLTVAVVEGTDAQYPALPDWTGLAVLSAVVVGIAGWIAAGRIYDMLPDEHGIYIVAFDGDPGGGEVHELSEDEFAAMEVHNGRLYEWPNALHRTYEVRSYDKQTNSAVANYRETAPGSELVSHHTASQAMDQIAELREEFEAEAERAKHIRRRLPSIIRKLDRQRAKDQARSLEPHLAPSTGDQAGITDVLEESMPAHLLPDHLQGDEAAQRAADDEADGWATFDLLDDTEPLDATGAAGGDPAVADD